MQKKKLSFGERGLKLLETYKRSNVLELNLDNTEKLISLVAGLIAIVAAIGTVAWKMRQRAGDGATEPSVPSVNATIGTQAVTVNVGATQAANAAGQPLKSSSNGLSSAADVKRTTNILFIDDDRGFKIVQILKKMGWEHAKLVTDITSLEQQNLLDAHVVFVDIQGVGRAMQYADEGLGLALAIKRRYPEKRIVIYSAEEKGARFHEALQEADYSLPKTAEPIRFEDTIFRVLNK
ncbi:hypothetical protein [Burkholderia lata]|uniref:hypothetical protein n=1 Tax=Burkholderia lata (strain ATCC 17760 / DSM 23089 / LMG 22485 / NCIMB 9086 / R18194 / 383) TaxID=482957 RepID=UPI00158168E0|nr:hypothetical protein [Burkholderia lata]